MTVNQISRLLLGFFLCLEMTSVSADGVRRDSGDDAVRKAQYMLRQLSQENTTLKAENARLSEQLAQAEKARDALEDSLNAQLDRSRASNQRLSERVREDSERIREVAEKYRQVTDLLRMEKANVAHLRNAVEERNRWIDVCKDNNQALQDINLELVDRFESKGVWQTLTQADALTGLGSVKVEVIAEDYIYKIEDLQVADFHGGNTRR